MNRPAGSHAVSEIEAAHWRDGESSLRLDASTSDTIPGQLFHQCLGFALRQPFGNGNWWRGRDRLRSLLSVAVSLDLDQSQKKPTAVLWDGVHHHAAGSGRNFAANEPFDVGELRSR